MLPVARSGHFTLAIATDRYLFFNELQLQGWIVYLAQRDREASRWNSECFAVALPVGAHDIQKVKQSGPCQSPQCLTCPMHMHMCFSRRASKALGWARHVIGVCNINAWCLPQRLQRAVLLRLNICFRLHVTKHSQDEIQLEAAPVSALAPSHEKACMYAQTKGYLRIDYARCSPEAT